MDPTLPSDAAQPLALSDPTTWLVAAFILLLLFASGFFSGSETALTAATRGKLRSMADKGDGSAKGAERALVLKEDNERLIGGILLGNNLMNILATSLATVLFTTLLGEGGVAAATLVMTALVLIFAEVLPKTYAINEPEKTAARAARPVALIIALLAPVVAVGWIMLIVATISMATMHHHRFRALVLLGIIGLSISTGFAYLSAPDLALTQISVETVTIMLLLLALHFMPKMTPRESPLGLKLRDAVIALGAGGGVAALSYAFLRRHIDTISDYHIANSYEGGGGTNVVNVILVDFRGYDTFGEIIVLGIAGFVIFALMHALLDGSAARRLKNLDYSQDRSRDRHPLMMVVVTRILMPIAIVVGLYIFLRGHNEPGGGFVAGLVIAIALLMQ